MISTDNSKKISNTNIKNIIYVIGIITGVILISYVTVLIVIKTENLYSQTESLINQEKQNTKQIQDNNKALDQINNQLDNTIKNICTQYQYYTPEMCDQYGVRP